MKTVYGIILTSIILTGCSHSPTRKVANVSAEEMEIGSKEIDSKVTARFKSQHGDDCMDMNIDLEKFDVTPKEMSGSTVLTLYKVGCQLNQNEYASFYIYNSSSDNSLNKIKELPLSVPVVTSKNTLAGFKSVLLTFGGEYNPKTRTLYAIQKGRGQGDNGVEAQYVLHAYGEFILRKWARDNSLDGKWTPKVIFQSTTAIPKDIE